MTPIDRMVELRAPILSPPKLRVAQTGNVQPPRIENGEWRITGQKQFFEKANAYDKLLVIRFNKPVTQQEINNESRLGGTKQTLQESNKKQALDGLNALKDALVEYGIVTAKINIVREDPIMPEKNPKNTFRQRCKQMLSDATKKFGFPSTIQFILVVLEQKDIAFYAEVKRWGDCDFGVPTVCVTAAKLQKVASDPKLKANIW